MSEHCTHDLHEREIAVALDGYCPLCQAADNAALRARVAELEAVGMMIHSCEIEILRDRVAELEAHNKQMWDFIVSLDGMNAGHMHDGAIDDEIAIVASDFNALAAAEHSQKPEPDRQD